MRGRTGDLGESVVLVVASGSLRAASTRWQVSYLREFLGTDADMPFLSTSHVSHENEVTLYPCFTNCVCRPCISFDSAGDGIVAGL